MIPLVGHVEELKRQKEIVLEEAERVLGKGGSGVEYLVGTMIEVPRGALTADEIAKEAEFFSFGTNDLTQMGFGLSRDDAGKFLLYYMEHGILDKDPFVSLDAAGVGQLVEIGVKKGRSVQARPEDRRLRRARRRSRRRSASSTRWASTTCPARPTACPSRAWPRPRPSSRSPSATKGNRHRGTEAGEHEESRLSRVSVSLWRLRREPRRAAARRPRQQDRRRRGGRAARLRW